jgi:hypothetical protein
MNIVLRTTIIQIAFGNTLNISRFHLKTEMYWKRFGFKHQFIHKKSFYIALNSRLSNQKTVLKILMLKNFQGALTDPWRRH